MALWSFAPLFDAPAWNACVVNQLAADEFEVYVPFRVVTPELFSRLVAYAWRMPGVTIDPCTYLGEAMYRIA